MRLEGGTVSSPSGGPGQRGGPGTVRGSGALARRYLLSYGSRRPCSKAAPCPAVLPLAAVPAKGSRPLPSPAAHPRTVSSPALARFFPQLRGRSDRIGEPIQFKAINRVAVFNFFENIPSSNTNKHVVLLPPLL